MRLFEFLAPLAQEPPSRVVSAVIDHVMELTGCQLRDDLAILAVRLAPPEPDAG